MIRSVVAGLAIAAGVVLLLLASDLRAWRDAIRADDVRFTAGAPVDGWRARTTLPFDAAERLLAVRDDRAFREALASFRLAQRTGIGLDNGVTQRRRRGDAESALAAVGGDDASQANDLLGVLAFADVASSGGSAPAERAQGAFATAIRLDPENEDAKYNLELLLRVLAPHGTRAGPNAAAGPHSTGRRGASSGTPGTGY